MKKIIGITAILLIFLSLGCIIQSSQETAKLTFGAIDYPGLGPLYLAQEKGFFAERGIEVEIIPMQDFSSMYAGIANGSLDLIDTTVDSFAIASSQGIGGKVIFPGSRSFGADGLVVSKEISSIEDLKGKEIALEKGTPAHFLLLKGLESKGLSGDDVIISDMSATDAGIAFVSGKVEVAGTWEPWLSEAIEKGDGKLLFSSKDFPVIVDGIIASENALSTKKELLKKFRLAWFEAVEYAKKNPKESNEIMGKAFGMSGEEFASFWEVVELFDFQKAEQVHKSLPGLFEEAGKTWKKEGFISSAKPAEEAISQEFI